MSTSEQPSLGEWLAEEPYTLVLSSGFFGFYAQSGVISALCERELTPIATRGSSTGAIATAMWAAASFEYTQIDTVLSEIERSDFWDPGIGRGLLKGKLLDKGLRKILADKSFEDCIVPVHISVHDIGSHQTEVLDSGDLTQAVHASIAFPFLFQPVIIDGKPKRDGGIKDHAGCSDAPKDERIFHQNLRPHRYNISDNGYLNSQTLTLEEIPFVHPLSRAGLAKGIEAFFIARAQTLIKLDEVI
jgi:NTE family protein